MIQENLPARTTVLLVEDDLQLRTTLARFLGYDYRVLTASNGEEGFRLFARHETEVELLLTDIHMSGMTGIELLTRVKQHKPDLAVIVMTGWLSSRVKTLLEARNVIAYLEKPFTYDQLSTLIARALQGQTVPPGFQGEVQGLGLADIIQLYCFSQARVALTISQGNEHGKIYIEAGTITDAVCPGKRAEAAFHHIMSWKQGTFKTHYGEEAPAKTITTHWEALLLDAMRRADEHKTESVVSKKEELS